MALLHDIVEIDASDVMVYDLADTSDKKPMVNNLLANNIVPKPISWLTT